MIKKHLKFSALLLAGALMVSCGSDDDVVPETSNEPEFPTEFSEQTVAANKASLEDNGIELVNGFTALKNTSGIKTSIAFGKHLDGSTLPENLEGGRMASNQGVRVMQLLASFGSGTTSGSKALSGLRVAEDDFVSFQQEFNDAVGVYTYSKANDTWTYQATGNKIVFKFPSTEAGTINNAEYSIYDYAGVKINSELGGDDYTGDYPTSLKADLTIDGTKKMGYTFAVAYNQAGDPSTIAISLTIDNYTLSYDVVNTTSKASVDYAITENGKNLLSLGVRSEGNFNTGVVEDRDGVNDVITSGSAYFQIVNIKFSGEVDADALVKALKTANTAADEAAAWNANYQLIVFYADSKKKIADSEFYSSTRTYIEQKNCEYIEIYDETNDEYYYEYICDEEEVTKDFIDVRMVFADGTKSDLETYTDVGFADFENKLEAFIEDLEND